MSRGRREERALPEKETRNEHAKGGRDDETKTGARCGGQAAGKQEPERKRGRRRKRGREKPTRVTRSPPRVGAVKQDTSIENPDCNRQRLAQFAGQEDTILERAALLALQSCAQFVSVLLADPGLGVCFCNALAGALFNALPLHPALQCSYYILI